MEQVLQWRTSEHVTKYMFTDIERNLDQQMEWFKSISQDDTQFYWMIEYRKAAIGLVSLNDLDRKNRKAASGYYLGDLHYTMIAGRILPYVYNFAFFDLGLNKLYAEVMEGNDGIMKMHLHHGYTPAATFKEHIYKYERFHDVHYFELLASTWKEQCQRYHRFTAEFTL